MVIEGIKKETVKKWVRFTFLLNLGLVKRFNGYICMSMGNIWLNTYLCGHVANFSWRIAKKSDL